MRKIILAFFLLTLGVSKAQIVGGYLPVNSSKSATIGTIRTNSLTVTANTITVASKVLTAPASSGTLANLSDAVFQLSFPIQSAVNPADATNYFFSNLNMPSWPTSSSANSILIPYNSTMIGYSINYIVNGTLGSAESATFSIDIGGSATALITNATFSSTTNTYTSSAVNININAGSLISAKLTTPTWATDPTNLRMGITFWFVRRS